MSNLIDFYKTGISHPQLNEGVYNCTLVKHELIDKDPSNPYIALTFKTDTGRILKENRFNGGFQIFISHLKQQLNRGNEEISVQDFLQNLISEKTPFKVWITKYTPYGPDGKPKQTRSNFNFLEPKEDTTPKNSGITIDQPKPQDAKLEEVKEDAPF